MKEQINKPARRSSADSATLISEPEANQSRMRLVRASGFVKSKSNGA
jgi:hypothetical protein